MKRGNCKIKKINDA